MNRTTTVDRQLQFDGRLMTLSGILTGVGSVVWLAGVSIGIGALVSTARQWIHQLERPPAEIARARWRQAAGASSAAVDAWKNSSVAARRS